MNRHVSYRSKLALALAAVALIPTLLLAGLSYSITQDSLHQRVVVESRAAVELAAAKASARIAVLGKALTYVANDANLTSTVQQSEIEYFEKYIKLTKTLQPLLNTTVFLTEDMESLTLYTLNPILIDKAPYIKSLNEVAAESWYAQALDGRALTWAVSGETLTGAYRVYTPIRNAPASMLVARIRAGCLLEETLVGGRRATSALLNEAGDIVYAIGDCPADLIDACSEANGEVHDDKQTYYYSSSRVSGTDWTLLLLTPVVMTIVDSGGFLPIVLWATVGCLSMVIIMTAFLSRMLTKRVRALLDNVLRIEGGDREVRAHTPGNDELSEISRSYDRMLDEINRLVEQVYISRLERKEADLKTLRAQINPHFLYNTLAMIHDMADAAGAPCVGEVARNLAVFYRTMLNRGDEEILLADEIKNIRAYIGIQLVAHDDAFDAQIDVDAHAEECLVINMLLQPLVENAVLHGVNALSGVRGLVRVGAVLRDGTLFLTVEDNGPGITPETARSLLSAPTGGYGIHSVRQRIHLRYGEAFGIHFDFSVTRGTRAVITLPCIKNTRK